MTTFIALSYAAEMTWALALVFFVLFPLIAHGLIIVAIGGSFGERSQNRRTDGNWRKPKD